MANVLAKNPRLLTRQEIIEGFHRMYMARVEMATRERGILRPGKGIPMEKLKDIFNESVADYVQSLLALL